MVDTAALLMNEQIAAFSRAEFVAGVHGAGLANVIFRGEAPLSLLEIFPNPSGLERAKHFGVLCETNGYRYRALIGDAQGEYPWENSFSLDPRALANALESILQPETSCNTSSPDATTT
jgi:capsular polysaccharide biosynthesis protein